MHALLRSFALICIALGALAAGPAFAQEVCGSAISVPEVEARALQSFAEQQRLKHPRAAAGTIWHVHSTGRLPDCYLTKRTAEERGWRPGGDLWRAAPGHAIGGDNFGNREGRLPQRNRYAEADLDYAGGRRGAARLVFARETMGRWLMWVTTDHYNTFREVPAPR
jgi:ribonuclease T1